MKDEPQGINDLNLNDPAIVASKNTVEKATQAAEAAEVSRAKQMESLLDEVEKRNVKTLSQVLRNVFGEYEDSGRFIDVKRIPLICSQITKIHEDISTLSTDMKIRNLSQQSSQRDIENINGNMKWIVRIIIGAVILALLGLILKGTNLTI